MSTYSHIYSGDVGKYGVNLTPRRGNYGSDTERVWVIEHLDSECSVPVGMTVTVLKRKLSRVK